MKQRLQEDLKAAIKGRDQPRMMTIRSVLTEITRLEKDVRREAREDEIIQVIKRERARREEALEFARKANRADLIALNQAEAGVLDSYLPAAASESDISAAIAEQLASGVSQIGPMMKALRERFGPSLDGRVASELVKQALARK